ncbi:hypothetical protein [Nostoc sp.]|uniref:hypothetical protein n=1 Tax=Nostoc sp. TaxID=1180 RepID=UPI002FFCD808
MTKPTKMSSKAAVTARCLVLHELDLFIDYIRATDPELKLDDATVLAAVALHQMSELLRQKPVLIHRFREAVANIKSKAHNSQ